MRRIVRAVGRALRLLLLCAGIVLALPASTLPLNDPWRRAGIIVGAQHFDYVGWEVAALAAKGEAALFGVHPFMPEDERTAFVRAYLADVERAGRLEGEIASIYAASADPERESAALRAEAAALRESLAARQTLTESIIEGQVAAVLVEQGFGVGGAVLPPVAIRFTRTPQFLVISPRDEIAFEIGFSLRPLPVDEAAEIERRIETALDMSALVVPIGGMALYPAMVLERTSIPSLLETTAHEWLHHYLFFFPLGLNYDFDGETRIINETTATLFGREVGAVAAARYYPELARGQTTRSKQTPFDFGAALDETRRTVDDLLAAGRVDEAEAYMEARRALFVANGYLFRRMNQAFFAFYGGYQSGAPGAGGADPIGEAVAALRAAAPSLRAWVETMRGITTRDHLLAAAEASRAASAAP